MTLSCFVSCEDQKKASTPASQSTPKTNDDTPTGDNNIPENEKINLDLESIDHEGAVVSIVHWVPQFDCVEFGMELDEINGDAVNDAIYKRNMYTETELGIDIDWVEMDYTYVKTKQLADKIRARLADPSTPVDVIAAQVKSMPCFITEGLLVDLNAYGDTLDLDKSWWPDDCKDALAVKGKNYFVSGDISANLLRMMTVLFVNKRTLAAKGHEYEPLMQMILEYEWTLDDLISITASTYEDLDAKFPGPSTGDKFGLVTTAVHSDAIFGGLGYKFMVKSNKENEAFRFSNHIISETAFNYVTTMKNWSENSDFWIDSEEDYYEDIFANGDSLFLLHRAWFGFELQKTEIQYAVIPTPALDKDQKEYFTTIGNQFSAYGICTSSPDYDIAAQTMQTLGYFAMSTTTPALFEVSFQGKFSKDDYTIKMFDIIRESVAFDVGRIYDYYIALESGNAATTQGLLETLLTYVVSNPIRYGTNFTFHSVGDPVRRRFNSYVDSANQKLMNYVDN